MTKRERDLLAIQFQEFQAELQELAQLRVGGGDPAEIEAALLGEQDEIEFLLGEDWFERRDELDSP